MGIVVCLAMLLGLVILRPSPFNGAHRVSFNPKFQRFVWIALAALGIWNTLYGLLKIDGFWCFMSVMSGLAMFLAAVLIASEDGDDDIEKSVIRSRAQNVIILMLGLSFLVYAVTLIQLNLGYPILR